MLQEQGKSEAAMEEYLKADEYAEKTKNVNLRGLSQSHIGEIQLKELLQTDAVQHFKIAIQYFHEAQNLKNEIISYNLTGNAYLMKAFNDSAFYYYNKGLQLAEANNDSLLIAKISENIGIAYRQAKQYDLAIEYLRNATKYINNDDKITLYLNFSKTFYEKGMLDSAKANIDKSLSLLPNNNDIFVAASIYKTLSKIAEKQVDFKQSLAYYKEYAANLTKIVDENRNKEILELQKKYNFEHFQNENNQLKINRQKVYISFSILLLIICLLTLFFYRKSAKSKKIALEKENQILEAEKKIYLLMEMSNSYSSKEKSFKNLLLYRFDILKKVALLKQYVTKDDKPSRSLMKKFNEIVYGQESLNWNLLYQDMDNLHNGFVSRLKECYSALTETEFHVCCLTYANFSCSEIAIILDLSPNTVQMKRSAIRKKLGIESQGNIQIFLKTQLRL